MNIKGPLGLIIMGAIGLIVAIVMFGIAVSQLDTAMTTVTGATNTFTGLSSIMGIYGIIFWVVVSGAGLALLGFGTAGMIKGSKGGAGSGKKPRGGRGRK